MQAHHRSRRLGWPANGQGDQTGRVDLSARLQRLTHEFRQEPCRGTEEGLFGVGQIDLAGQAVHRHPKMLLSDRTQKAETSRMKMAQTDHVNEGTGPHRI